MDISNVFRLKLFGRYRVLNRAKNAFDDWVGALWDIRQKYGKQFADSAIAFSLRAFNDFRDLDGNPKLDPNTYLRDSVLTGEAAVDNKLSNRAGINEILNRHGFH